MTFRMFWSTVGAEALEPPDLLLVSHWDLSAVLSRDTAGDC